MKRGWLAITALIWTVSADASPIDCRKGQCDLLKNGAYPAVVIGKVDHVGTDRELGSVYQWATRHRYWRNLPQGKSSYLAAANLIAVIPPPSNSLASPSALLMGRDEFNTVKIEPGDLVRYAPHRKAHEAPQGDATGCIAPLCKAQDKGCFGRYQEGTFSRDTGEQIDAVKGTPIPGGTAIDTTTWLPLNKAGASRSQ